MAEKIRIEKNSVEETLIIPLYARVQCAMNEKFTGCRLVFDTAGKAALKAMIKRL